ncbi:MAG: hypothetical protein AAGJ86_04470 [Pseudomonadota bacterium]
MSGFKLRGTLLALISVGVSGAGCVSVPAVPPGAVASAPVSQAMLLVSRPDGTVVQQRIDLDADVCMKAAETPRTTCFKQGDAMFDTAGVLVGFEMTEQRYELYPTQ